MEESKLVTNVDARTNARIHYNHQIIKYKLHDLAKDDTCDPGELTETCYSHMAQSHKKSTAARWLTDFLG